MPVGGRLVFKGGEAAKAANKGKKKKRRTRKDDTAEDGAVADAGAVDSDSSKGPIQVLKGAGRITTSGTALQGHGTSFMSQLSQGDALIVTHPSTLMDETRLVSMVLSDTSIGISSAFSSDLISTTSFHYVKAPKKTASAEDQRVAQKKRKAQEEDSAFGTYSSGGGDRIVYRVKKAGTYGGYEIVTEDAHQDMSREDLLKVRSQKKSDRYCY
jgi:hypothetical protein